MECEYCGEEYVIKPAYIAKTCGCDEDYRFISFDEWYNILFKFSYLDNKKPLSE